jgi:hypothetical protein
VLTGRDAESDGLRPIPHRPVPANPYEVPLKNGGEQLLNALFPKPCRRGIGKDSAAPCATGSRAMETAKSCRSRLFGRVAHGSLSSSLSRPSPGQMIVIAAIMRDTTLTV